MVWYIGMVKGELSQFRAISFDFLKTSLNSQRNNRPPMVANGCHGVGCRWSGGVDGGRLGYSEPSNLALFPLGGMVVWSGQKKAVKPPLIAFAVIWGFTWWYFKAKFMQLVRACR